MKQEQSLAFQNRGLDQRTTALVTDDPSVVLPARWPTHIPLVRITTCGRLDIAVLHAITTDATGEAQGIYGPLDGHQRAEKGSATALRLRCLLASQSRGFASKDLISEKLRRFSPEGDSEDDEPDGLKRVDNVVSRLRRLLLPPLLKTLPEAMPVRQRLVTFHRATSESGPGYQLCGLPLIWLDVQVIQDAAKRARALTQFGQDGTAEWQTAYELASSGSFLPDGKTFASGSHDGTIKIWDTQMGVCLKTVRSDRPYEQMNITRATGLTTAQKTMLVALGAMYIQCSFERENRIPPSHASQMERRVSGDHSPVQ